VNDEETPVQAAAKGSPRGAASGSRATVALVLSLAIVTLGSIILAKLSASATSTAGSADPAAGALDSALQPPDASLVNLEYLSRLRPSQIDSMLSPRLIGRLDHGQAERFGATLASYALARGKNPEAYYATVLPSASEILAMISRDRDVDDYLEHAEERGPAGEYYKHVASLVPGMKPLRQVYEHLFTGMFDSMKKHDRLKVPSELYPEAEAWKSGVTLPRLSSRPRESEYAYSHTFALDIFVKDVVTLPGGLEKGPVLFSLADSIVLATDNSWHGGEDFSTYRYGGITPKAGNGVILFSPSTRKYYLYFHLYNVFVSPGDTIPEGFPLGHAGNTGTNARKPGHGEHLHLEIWDAASQRFLRNHEISRIVF
jgi:hypothetical protein